MNREMRDSTALMPRRTVARRRAVVSPRAIPDATATVRNPARTTTAPAIVTTARAGPSDSGTR